MARTGVHSNGDKIKRVVLTAAGLAGLAAVFAVAVPRQAEIAGGRSSRGVSAERIDRPISGATRASEPDAGGGMPSAGSAPAPLGGTSGQGGVLPRAIPETGLRRLPPRQLPRLDEPELGPGPEKAADIAPQDNAPDAPRPTLLPRPVAVDTATFLVGKARVELLGIQPVAPSRVCSSGGTVAWPCGMQARTALRSFLRARSIRCDVPEGFGQSSSTIESNCSLGKADIGGWLIANGWARAKAGGPYEADERTARDKRKGIWGDGAAQVDTVTTDAQPAATIAEETGTP